jgi:hypothetical protein
MMTSEQKKTKTDQKRFVFSHALICYDRNAGYAENHVMASLM